MESASSVTDNVENSDETRRKTRSETRERSLDLKMEKNRLATFKDWPVNLFFIVIFLKYFFDNFLLF